MITPSVANSWPKESWARAVSVAILGSTGVVLAICVASHEGGRTLFGPMVGGDYGEFYAIGTLLERGQWDRLYDLELQDQLLQQALPDSPAGEHLPFVYPPPVALLFRTLAKLPYFWSYLAWLVASLGLYAASVALVLRLPGAVGGREATTAWLLALSFGPFALTCLLIGQLSSLACLAIASGLACRRAGRPFLAGLALSAMLYKPSLPWLIVPMVLVGRQWRMLAGFGVGGIAMALLSLAVAGEAACLDFAGLMLGYGRDGSVGVGFKTNKFVDLRAFLGLVGLDRGVSNLAAGLIGMPALAGLIVAWARVDRGPRSDLAWAATICWTPVLNLYGPIYDVSIVAPGLILAAGAIKPSDGEPWPSTFRWLLAVVYGSAMVSTSMAQGLGFQPLTLALGAMGTYLLRESIRRD